MLVLGIETATVYTGVAVLDEENVLGEQVVRGGVAHSHYLLAMTQRLLGDCGISRDRLDGIAVSLGPGSFTGLRIGVATAKALAYALGKSLAGVPTLDVLAHGVAVAGALVCPVLDARMGEVYTCLYRCGEREVGRLADYLAMSATELLARLRGEEGPIVLVGELPAATWRQLAKGLGRKGVPAPANLNLPRPTTVARLGMIRLQQGAGDDPLRLQPLYVRRTQAEVASGTGRGRRGGGPCGAGD